MPRLSVSQMLVLLATVATIAVNFLATTLPLGGNTTEELSDRFPVLVTPAGYVFSIWGLIYLSMVAFALYQALPACRDAPPLRAIRVPFLLSSGANVAWLYLWHYEQVTLSLVAMLVLLGALVWITWCLGRQHVGITTAERWFVQRVFSLYLGWISVATIVNVAVVLFNAGWHGGPLPGEGWAAILLALAALLGIAFALFRGDRVYAGVVVWALVGIAIKQSAEVLVVLAAGAGAVAVGLAIAWSWLLWRRQPTQRPALPAA